MFVQIFGSWILLMIRCESFSWRDSRDSTRGDAFVNFLVFSTGNLVLLLLFFYRYTSGLPFFSSQR